MHSEEDAASSVQLYPRWREALQLLIQEGMPYGRLISKAHLVKLFGLKEPKTARDQREFDLEFFGMLSALRAELLEAHQLDLQTVWGRSQYVVNAPGEQTEAAMRDGMADIKRVIVKTHRRLTFIRHAELTDDESRRNADALAKTAALAMMVNRHRIGHDPD